MIWCLLRIDEVPLTFAEKQLLKIVRKNKRNRHRIIIRRKWFIRRKVNYFSNL